MTQKPIEEIIGEFSETGASHIREFHLRLFGGGVPRISLGNIGRNRACYLRHLIKLAAAGVAFAREEAPAEGECLELHEVEENIGVEAFVAGGGLEEWRCHNNRDFSKTA